MVSQHPYVQKKDDNSTHPVVLVKELEARIQGKHGAKHLHRVPQTR